MGTEPLLFITWNPTQLYARKVYFRQLAVFPLLNLWWSHVGIKIPYPGLFPLTISHPNPIKHEIPLPHATEIPASRSCFQLKSRTSPWKKAKSRIPPNLLGTLFYHSKITFISSRRHVISFPYLMFWLEVRQISKDRPFFLRNKWPRIFVTTEEKWNRVRIVLQLHGIIPFYRLRFYYNLFWSCLLLFRNAWL